MGCGSSNSVETKESKKTNQNLDKVPEKEEEKQNINFSPNNDIEVKADKENNKGNQNTLYPETKNKNYNQSMPNKEEQIKEENINKELPKQIDFE